MMFTILEIPSGIARSIAFNLKASTQRRHQYHVMREGGSGQTWYTHTVLWDFSAPPPPGQLIWLDLRLCRLNRICDASCAKLQSPRISHQTSSILLAIQVQCAKPLLDGKKKLQFLGFLFYLCCGNFMKFEIQMVLCHICSILTTVFDASSINSCEFFPPLWFNPSNFSVVQFCTLLKDIIKQIPEEKLLKPTDGYCLALYQEVCHTQSSIISVIQPKWEKNSFPMITLVGWSNCIYQFQEGKVISYIALTANQVNKRHLSDQTKIGKSQTCHSAFPLKKELTISCLHRFWGG